MKKKTIINIVLSSLLAVAIPSLISIVNANKEMNKASATINNLVTGTFARVTSASQITNGGSYIFVSEDGYALTDVCGNPGFVFGQRDGVSNSGQGLVTLYNSPASVFSVEEVNGNFAFYTSMNATGQYINKVYLAFNEKQFEGVFDAIAYFYGDRTGIDVNRTDDAIWSFRYDENEGNYISNVARGGDLSFTTGYAPHFFRGMGSRVEIYKEYISEQTIDPYKKPDITEYAKGEEINLSGLTIGFHSSYHDSDYSYNQYPYLFSFDKYASGSGEHDFEITFMNIFTFNIKITVNQAEYYASKVTSPLADYRGQYLLAPDYGRVLDGTNTNNPVTSVPCSNGKIKVANHSDEENVKFTVEKANNNFYLKNIEGEYLSLQGNIHYIANRSYPIIFEYDQGGIRIKGSDQDGMYLNFNDDFKFCLGGKNTEGHDPVFLHKYEYTNEVLNALDSFANGFLSATMVCDYSGISNNITNEIWSAQAQAFGELDGFAQAELINKKYTYGNTEGDVIAQAVERYDYIISKYGTSTFSDFISRSTYGTMQNHFSSLYMNIETNYNDSAIPNVIIICVAIPLTGIAFVSFIHFKRKHN